MRRKKKEDNFVQKFEDVNGGFLVSYKGEKYVLRPKCDTDVSFTNLKKPYNRCKLVGKLKLKKERGAGNENSTGGKCINNLLPTTCNNRFSPSRYNHESTLTNNQNKQRPICDLPSSNLADHKSSPNNEENGTDDDLIADTQLFLNCIEKMRNERRNRKPRR